MAGPYGAEREHRGNSAFLLFRQNLRKGASEMYTGYQIYQAERPKSAREQREIDTGNAKLAQAVGRFGRLLARPVCPRRQTWRPAPGRPAPCPETSR
jgi:hypothetical protein